MAAWATLEAQATLMRRHIAEVGPIDPATGLAPEPAHEPLAATTEPAPADDATAATTTDQEADR